MVLLRALLVSALVFVANGCGQASVPSSSVAAPSASGAPTFSPLESEIPAPTPQLLAIVSLETRGGECPNGACARLVKIEGDGTLHEVIPTDQVLGTVPAPALEALRIEIDQANFPLLRRTPFTGECPTAFDGQETIYTFHAAAGDEVFATCTVAIDPNHPLFQAVAAAVAAAGE